MKTRETIFFNCSFVFFFFSFWTFLHMDFFSSVIASTHSTNFSSRTIPHFHSLFIILQCIAVGKSFSHVFADENSILKSVKIESNEMKNWKKIDLFVDLICEIHMRWQKLHWFYWFQRLEASFEMPLYQIQTSKWCHSQSIRTDRNPLQYFKLVCTWEKNRTSLLHSKQVYWCLSFSILFRAWTRVCVVCVCVT